MGEWRIRRFDPDRDLASVMNLNRIFLPEWYPRGFFLRNYERWPASFLVAESEGGEVVGYVMCRVEPPVYLGTRRVVLGHVLSIAVHSDWRRRGIGRALMLEAERAMRSEYGAQVIFLEVRVSNSPAISLYEKIGYEKLGRIPRYYSDGEDAYLMYKRVSEELTEGECREALMVRCRGVIPLGG